MGFGDFKSLVLSHLYCPRKDSCVLTQGFKGGSPFLCVSACVICPAIKQEIELLLGPSLPEYVNFVEKYKNDNATLENAENLKKCVDSKLTEVDKEYVLSLPVSSIVSVSVPGAALITPVRDGACVRPRPCNFYVHKESCLF